MFLVPVTSIDYQLVISQEICGSIGLQLLAKLSHVSNALHIYCQVKQNIPVMLYTI